MELDLLSQSLNGTSPDIPLFFVCQTKNNTGQSGAAQGLDRQRHHTANRRPARPVQGLRAMLTGRVPCARRASKLPRNRGTVSISRKQLFHSAYFIGSGGSGAPFSRKLLLQTFQYRATAGVSIRTNPFLIGQRPMDDQSKALHGSTRPSCPCKSNKYTARTEKNVKKCLNFYTDSMAKL